MRPSGHAVSCEECGQRMPYDPSAANLLCNTCNRRRALGLSYNRPPQSQPFQAQNPHAFTQPTTPPSNLHYHSNDAPRPTMTPGLEGFTNSPYVSSSMPDKYLAGQKRKYETTQELVQSPSKRFPSNAYVPNTPSALRQTAWPPAQSTGYAGGVTSEAEDEDGDEFVDAPEDQGLDIGGAAAGSPAPEHNSDGADSTVDADVEDDEQYQASSKGEETREQHERDASPENPPPEQAAHDEEDDLFAQTFGGGSKLATSNAAVANDNDSDSDIEEIGPASAGKSFDRSAFIASVSKNNPNNKPTTTTTTTTTRAPALAARKPFTPKHTLGVIPAVIPRHIARNLRSYHTFHYNSINLIPRLPLASSRFWIGVLCKSAPPSRSNLSEKHFTWMKGNRLTTVETIWRAYCAGNGEEEADDVALLVGGERPGMGVRCEELDYFGDRKVIFCAMDVRTDPGRARGRGLAEELIREVQEVGEVIEID